MKKGNCSADLCTCCADCNKSAMHPKEAPGEVPAGV